jgi:hypothetical protein
MKKAILVLLLFMGVTGAMAQQVYNSSGKTNYKKKKKTGYDPDKLVLGGGFNLGLGTGFASFGVAPIVGYRVLEPLFVGVGVGYLYQKGYPQPDQYNKLHYQYLNIIYPNLWARCFVYRNIYISASYEYDIINVKYPDWDYSSGTGNMVQRTANVTNNCALVGIGMRNQISGRLSFYGELVYDVIQGKYSPYPVGFPGFRFGLAAGL